MLPVLVMFHLTCFHIIFSSVSVVEWHPFGKYLLTWLTICSQCVLTIFPGFILGAGFGFRFLQFLTFAYF